MYFPKKYTYDMKWQIITYLCWNGLCGQSSFIHNLILLTLFETKYKNAKVFLDSLAWIIKIFIWSAFVIPTWKKKLPKNTSCAVS